MSYDVVSIPASRATYTQGRGGADVLWLVIHYTGADGSARDNGYYFAGGNRNASAQYFVDNIDIVLSVSEEDTAWAVGNFAANQRSISIEVCSAGEDFSEAEIERLTWLVGDLMARYGIDADHVVRHRDMYRVATAAGIGGSWVDPGKACPAPYVDDEKWAALHARITGGGDMDEDIRYMQALAAPMCERARVEPPAATGAWSQDTQRALVHLAQVQMLACMDPTLYPSGEVGGQSRAVMDAHPVSRGDSGLAAWAVKAALVGRGYKGADVGGWTGMDLTSWDFDEVAETALRSFQADFGCKVTGTADASTWCTLCPNMYSDNPNR